MIEFDNSFDIDSLLASLLLATKVTMNVPTKICGITRIEDAMSAIYAGAWALGFIFYKKSPRYISPSKAKKIIEALPPFVTPVGVFVNQGEGAVRDIARFTGIQTLQFHGDEKPDYFKRFKDYKTIKVFRVGHRLDLSTIDQYKVNAFLFDAQKEGVYGGSGKSFDWELLRDRKLPKPVILSGGLNPENVKQALLIVQPFAVDVSSGVEKEPGIKDPKLIREFIENVRV